jgi:hypothetical protein
MVLVDLPEIVQFESLKKSQSEPEFQLLLT